MEGLLLAGGDAIASPRTRLAVAVLSTCAALALSAVAPAAGAPLSLGPAHLGVALAAPTPPALGEADEVAYQWQRCAFYTTLVAVDGASHMWRLDDASASTTATDVLGSAPGRYVGAHAAAGSDPLVDQGAAGAAFDGSTSAVELPGVADEPGTDAYTFELWARPERADGVYRFLISREETVAGKRAGTGVWLSTAGLGFERWSGGRARPSTTRRASPSDAWSYVVASYDGTTMRLYVNGEQVGSKATAAPLGEVSARP